ncbi:interferon-induced GTP-binding protein Mx2, partial [Metarhizium majus ARSEF 297]
MAVPEGTDLVSKNLLTKIDRLRETNVGAIIPLPQLIVVGDQSSGKSSVLESVTGFSFPRAAGLCTRYATQITCIREAERRVSVSIIPRPDAEGPLKERLLKFNRQLSQMNNEELAKVFEEANIAMGISMDTVDNSSDFSAFSQDILKIEINGPDQVHLTVIDVPGIFRVPTPGLTAESDVVLVRNIVKGYMENRRTIILAVMPCNVDIATQEILKLAEEADPDGIRTMGVLTKPDLATEKATQDAVIDLVKGKRNNLKLGYCVVKNRSADDNTSNMSDRLAAEQAFFMAPPWSSVADRCGVPSLQLRLRELLMEISKRELPNVKSEIEKHKRECVARLAAMGEPRADDNSQRQYLVKIASRMQDITKSALNGYYAGEALFKKKPGFKLITKILKLNETFSNEFWKRGHYQHFGSKWDDEGENMLGNNAELFPFDTPFSLYQELADIIVTDFECPKALKGPMTPLIQEVYDSSRGPELGTFNGTVLADVFDTTTQKWEGLVVTHTSKAIVLVHDYIYNLLNELCPDPAVMDQLWDNILVEELCERYRRAMEMARFLLEIERSRPPLTFNHYFNATLQKKRQERMAESLQSIAIHFHHDNRAFVPLEQIGKHAVNMDNTQQVCEDILDTLESYYKVARKRFVDTICQHVVDYMLLGGPESPLKVLCADRVLKLSSEQLEIIAGEDTASKNQRQVLTRELESLQKAAQVLRS